MEANNPGTRDASLERSSGSSSTRTDGGLKNEKRLKIVSGVLMAVTVCAAGFGVFGMVQGAKKDDQIASLKAQVEDLGGAVDFEPGEEDGPVDGDNLGSGLVVGENNSAGDTPDGIYFLYDDFSFKDQRYRLLVVNKNDDDFMTTNSEDDDFYILDMDKIGSSDSLKGIDLVSLLKPLTDEIIENELPETSTNALGWVTNKAQCESFSVIYYDPRSSLAGAGTEGLDLESEVPIRASIFCHQNNNTSQVAFYELIYILNAENNTVRKHPIYSGKNNFQR